MVLDRVHLLELRHMRRAITTCLALGFSKLAAKGFIFSILCITLCDHISLDLGSLSAKFLHQTLRITTKGGIGSVARESEREIGSRNANLGRCVRRNARAAGVLDVCEAQSHRGGGFAHIVMSFAWVHLFMGGLHGR